MDPFIGYSLSTDTVSHHHQQQQHYYHHQYHPGINENSIQQELERSSSFNSDASGRANSSLLSSGAAATAHAIGSLSGPSTTLSIHSQRVGHQGFSYFGGYMADELTTSTLNASFVRSIVERLLESAPIEPPLHAFSQAVAGTSGKAAFGGRTVNRHSGIAIREYTELPVFQRQIDHIISEIRSAKRPNKPFLLEGPPGLGKGTALQQYVAQEGQVRPAVYLQLSMVLRKRHGSSSSVEDEEEDDFYTETETETEGPEERVQLSVKRNAWKCAIEKALGADIEEVFLSADSLVADGEQDLQDCSVDMSVLEHIAQALRLISSKSRAGPTVLVIDDVQLLFRERAPLSDKYEGIPEVFSWLLKCEMEGILSVVMCSSEKSAVGGIKRIRGYDWGLTLHAIESVEDEAVIKYLLDEVNPIILDPAKKFNEDSASLFVATFDGSLLELDNYIRDQRSSVHTFIAKRERSFLRHLQRNLPVRIKKPHHFSPPTTSQYGYKPPSLSSEEELRELFLDIIMRGGVLPVARLDVTRMALVEALVERNILRWRDQRIRRRESRPSMRPGWIPPAAILVNNTSSSDSNEGSGSDNEEEESRDIDGSFVDVSSSVSVSPTTTTACATTTRPSSSVMPLCPPLTSLSQPSLTSAPPAAAADTSSNNKTSRIFGMSRPNNWFRSSSKSSATSSPASQPSISSAGSSSGSLSMDSSIGTVIPNAVPLSTNSSVNDWNGPVMEDQWAGAVSQPAEITSTADLDAAEQLALFAREGAELVWSNNLVRTVCEGFVNGATLQW